MQNNLGIVNEAYNKCVTVYMTADVDPGLTNIPDQNDENYASWVWGWNMAIEDIRNNGYVVRFH